MQCKNIDPGNGEIQNKHMSVEAGLERQSKLDTFYVISAVKEDSDNFEEEQYSMIIKNIEDTSEFKSFW